MQERFALDLKKQRRAFELEKKGLMAQLHVAKEEAKRCGIGAGGLG